MYICIYIYVYNETGFQIKKITFLKVKASWRFIDNLQPTNSNVKLLQCYGIFLTSLNLKVARNNMRLLYSLLLLMTLLFLKHLLSGDYLFNAL